MKITVPDYYKKFRCIADKCKHSCCIGWEIDIDEDTYEYYKSVSGKLGEKLGKCIGTDRDEPYFILQEKERCPFLNENNLCEIILEKGEEHISQICTDHPRFRNFFSDRTETGLGLCCEEAGRIILSDKEKVRLIDISDDGENEETEETEDMFFAFRNDIFDILQNRNKSIDERINDLCIKYNIKNINPDNKELAKIYIDLEHLDNAWCERLEELENSDFQVTKKNFFDEWDIIAEQIIIYFIYRHLADGIYDGKYIERIEFAILGYRMIERLCYMSFQKSGSLEFEEIVDIARMYSSEIEYDEENIERLLDI